MSREEQQLKSLEIIERRDRPPTQDEWAGILHHIATNPEQRMLHRIRALAQMDRITGEPGDLTPTAVEDYTMLCGDS